MPKIRSSYDFGTDQPSEKRTADTEGIRRSWSADTSIILPTNATKITKKRSKNSQSMDFDDLIMLTVKLFQEYPETLSYYQNKFHYIHVDESIPTTPNTTRCSCWPTNSKTSASSAMRTKASTVGAVLTWRTSSTSKRIIRMQSGLAGAEPSLHQKSCVQPMM